jgi:diadenosine tetraphosphate (Ap4A) HIT family hydrolase
VEDRRHPGYTVAVWKGRHVAEPTELAADEIAAYWREVMAIGRAIETVFEPAKMNYETLGNNVPHPHTHIVPRSWVDDPAPNDALSFEFLDRPRQPEAQVHRAVVAVQSYLRDV